MITTPSPTGFGSEDSGNVLDHHAGLNQRGLAAVRGM
jgi:hypothetical protein